MLKTLDFIYLNLFLSILTILLINYSQSIEFIYYFLNLKFFSYVIVLESIRFFQFYLVSLIVKQFHFLSFKFNEYTVMYFQILFMRIINLTFRFIIQNLYFGFLVLSIKKFCFPTLN